MKNILKNNPYRGFFAKIVGFGYTARGIPALTRGKLVSEEDFRLIDNPTLDNNPNNRAIYVANYQCGPDSVFMAMAVKRRLRWISTAKYNIIPGVKPFMNSLGTVFVGSGSRDQVIDYMAEKTFFQDNC